MAKNENVDIMRATAARYSLEHYFLPTAFYAEDAVDFLFCVTSLTREHVGPYLSRFYSRVAAYTQSAENVKVPQVEYDPADFYSQVILSPYEALQDESLRNSDARVIRVDMPEPERAVLCARIYFCFSGENFENRMVFTVERRLILPDELDKSDVPPADCLLCGWDRELNHINTGEFIYSGIDPKLMEQVRNELGADKSEEEVYSHYRSVHAKTELRHILELFDEFVRSGTAKAAKKTD